MARSGSRRASGNGSSRGATSQIYDDILSLAGSLIGSRKEKGADQLTAFADATRQYGESLDIPHINAYVSSAADQLDYLSDYMVDNDLEKMLADAAAFAKRHPAAAFGLVAAAGFAVTRFASMRQAPPARGRAREKARTGGSSRRRVHSRAAAGSGGRNSRSRTPIEEAAASNA